uniref:RIMS-binding protein 2 n=1 Tax=Tetraodon nigroviridis TaxID=99883 RepID=H3CT08_TETNG
GFLVRQNAELLRALNKLEKTCTTLREENGLLRKSSAPETEEKVRRLRRKNTELAVLAKRLEERARKLQEANLKVVNSPSLMRPGSAEQYKRAFARQRARDLAQHADALLSKDKEIAALQQECRELEAQGSSVSSDRGEFERLLRESQREVLRLQRQLSVTSSRQQHHHSPSPDPPQTNEAPSRCEKTPGEEEESGVQVTPHPGLSPLPVQQERHTEEQRLKSLERELSSKRKECENLEHEVKKRQKRCQDLGGQESQLKDERSKNERLEEETDLLRRKAQLLHQTQAENEELREDLSKVTAQHSSVLEENQRLRAKLENLEQVLKHMREVAERRQQLELEHEQALAILKFKQDEIKRLQRAQLFAKREHEGVVQMLESTLDCMQSKVRDLEEKCRTQSEQFGLLSQELEKFRLQASKVDLAGSSLLNNPSCLCWRTTSSTATVPSCLEIPWVERSPVTKHRELPTISVSKSGSTSSKSETANVTPKSDTHLSPHKSSSTHEVDTASEVEELDVDIAPAPYTPSRGAAKLQVFIARYSYNPYDGPNDNPELELPLTAGEYIYVYGDMDDDGFYEGELMDGRRGLVPSNFVERVSDDDVMSAHPPGTGDMSHNSLLDSSLHSASHQHHLHMGASASERTEVSAASGPASAPSDSASALAVPAPLTNGLDLDLEEVGVDTVPYPRKLTLIKQLAKSIIIGWDPPLVPAGWGNVWSYNIYVDQELRLNVPFGSQTKAVLERLDINLKTYRVSVQSLTEKGLSEQLRCSFLVGRDVCVAPTQLRVEKITATSANVTWLPSNSNYVHIVSLNEEECELVKAGCYSLCLNTLLPSLQYTVKVEARPHRTPWELPVERREHRSATVTFTTLMAGPPDAPLDVQLEHGPSPGIAVISWLPVTIDASGTSNGVRVTGYTIYADKRKVLEVSSPTAGSALLGPSQIQSLQSAQELTVRTMSAHGESCDSFPVSVPSKLAAIMVPINCPCHQPMETPLPKSPYVQVSVTSPITSAPLSAVVAQGPVPTSAAVLDLSRDTDSPGTIRPFPSITEFIEDPCAKLGTPERIPTPPKAPISDLLNPQDSNLLRPPPASPLESEVEDETENTRLVSIEEFLRQDQEPNCRTQQSYSRAHVEPASDYHADNSRSDLSDILEEEEEDLYSDHFSEKQGRGYTVGANRPPRSDPADSDEEVLEKILTLPPQACSSKQLFSIPEVTEEEDSSQEEHLAQHRQSRSRPRGSEHFHHAPQHPPNPHTNYPPQNSRCVTKEPSLTHRQTQEEDLGLYQGPAARRVSPRCPAQPNRNSKERVLLRGLGDRLRREAMLRSQMAVTAATNPGYGLTPPRPYPVSRTVRTLKSAIGRGVEIDVEYGTDDNEEAVERSPGEVVVDQMSSEWWVEGVFWVVQVIVSQSEAPCVNGSSLSRKAPSVSSALSVLLDRSSARSIPLRQAHHGEARQQFHLNRRASRPGNSKVRGLVVSRSVFPPLSVFPLYSPKIRDGEARIFVALFSYEPATMSPNPDAAEEELPFSEGQIIKVHGDKDPDGFYRGECGGRLGFVPCNMVSEIQVEDEETRQQLLQQGYLSTAASVDNVGTRTHAQTPRRPVPPPKPRRSKKGRPPHLSSLSPADPSQSAASARQAAPGARRMVAIFDYDPRESSPNTDIEAELTFSAGDVIHVFGDMDEDGFFYGDLNGHRGLVPSNFLQ